MSMGNRWRRGDFEGRKSEDASDWVVYDGIAKEDVVRVAADPTLKTLGTVTKMEAVKGEVTSITTSKDTAVVDGTTYNYSEAADDTTMKTYLEETIEFYVINGFMFDIDADVAADLSDFVILADVAETAGLGGYYDAEIIFTDGTSEVVKAKAASGSLSEDSLYTYEVEDGKYELTAATLTTEEFDNFGNKGDTISWVAADKDADTAAKIDGYKFAADAVVLVKTEDGYVLKTGADLAKVTDTTATVYYYGANTNDKTNVTNIAFVVVVTEGTSVSEWQYGFVTSEIETKANTDGDYSVLTVWNGTESVDLTTKAGVVADTDKGGVVKFKVNEEGLVSEIADLSKGANAAVAGAVTVIDGDEITVKYAGGTVPFTVDEDDTVVIYVDKSENVGMPADEIVLADKDEYDAEINNVYIYDVEFDKTLEVIVVDIDNDWLGNQ